MKKKGINSEGEGNSPSSKKKKKKKKKPYRERKVFSLLLNQNPSRKGGKFQEKRKTTDSSGSPGISKTHQGKKNEALEESA